MSRKPKKRRKSGRTRKFPSKPPVALEWVGGRLSTPAYITEPEPYRPEMILWLELPGDYIVASTLIDPDQPPVSFGRTLLDAMASPMVGPARRPARIRVADAHLAAEVRNSAPGIEVVVAPTPELDQILGHMAESFSTGAGGDLSYFESGRIDSRDIEALFSAGDLLFRAAPWQLADDDQVLRLDIPALGINAACVSIIGALGESLGFIVFPSLAAYRSFLDASQAGFGAGGPIDLGTSSLSLNFERGADLPATMRREAIEHGWPVAGPAAYPWVQHRDRDGMPRPLSERDVRVVSACATSLATFFFKHRDLFESASCEPVCESFLDKDDLEVRFTVPYEAGHLFAVNDSSTAVPAASPKAKIGRNSPCPCGSGKKYKKCCLGKDRAVTDTATAAANVHELDRRLIDQVLHFAARRFPEAWQQAGKGFADAEAAVQLFEPWLAYHITHQGKPLGHWFVRDREHKLSTSERQWLKAQQAAWLSVWEVCAVESGTRIILKDLLSHEERTVEEVSASQTLMARDAILARIVDCAGMSVLCGCHPRPLPPVETAEVVQRTRGRLRRKRAVPIDRLREEKIGRYMIARWEEAVEDLDARSQILPRLQNSDGEQLLLTVDHFEFEPAQRQRIETDLASIEGAEAPQPGHQEQALVFTQPGATMSRGAQNTVIGRAEIAAGRIRLETNSIERADQLRERIEQACGGALRHLAREHSDPLALSARPGQGPDTGGFPDDLPPGVANQLILEFKDKHYADWADQPLPALKGLTPRQAVGTRAGRQSVDLLLKDCENHEARIPEGQRFDFSGLRRELGL